MLRPVQRSTELVSSRSVARERGMRAWVERNAGQQPVYSPVTRHGWTAGCRSATDETLALAGNALRPTCRNVQRRIPVPRIERTWSSVGLARTRLPQRLSLSREMNVTQMHRAFHAIAPPVINTIAAFSRASSAHVGFPREAAARKGLRSIVCPYVISDSH